MKVNGFILANEDKVNRAIYGYKTDKGSLIPGVGEDASPEQILSEYDRLGGFITKDGEKVKNGSFYDYQAKKTRTEPLVMFMTDIDGEIVEVSEEEAKAVKVARKKKDEIKNKLKRKKVETIE